MKEESAAKKNPPEAKESPRKVNRRAFFLQSTMSLGGLGAAAALSTQLVSPTARGADSPVADATAQLGVQTKRNLRWAGNARRDWVRPRAGADHNVVIVGGGQSGLGIAYGLRRYGIGKVDLIDRADPGQAGIWRSIARMHQLRTSKTLVGPEQGNPDLGFRAWYETLQGPAAFDALDRIPRLAWADYLAWFEQTTGANVRYRTRLLDVEPADGLLRLHLESDGIRRTETTRKLVLANGFAGAGGRAVPKFLHALPASVWSHTDAPFDFDSLAGKVVAVIGAGASAFDAAATAIEHGAAEVHMFNRRAYVDYSPSRPAVGSAPQPVAAVGSAQQPALYRGHANVVELAYELPDEIRWRNHRQLETLAALVPLDSIDRVVRHKNFHLHLSSEWKEVAIAGNGKVNAKIGGKTRRFDHVIAGTGYRIDLSAQPELARIHPGIALWRDRFRPPAGEEDDAVGSHPYLGAGLQFLPREAGSADHLRNIHCFNLAASASYGILVGTIPSAVLQPRLVSAIARDLYAEVVDVEANARFVSKPFVAPDPAPYKMAVSPV